jgi:hypothetical protein
VTVPVGVPVPEDGVTVALKLTSVPALTVVAEAVSAVVVAVSVGAETVMMVAADVLAAKVELPPYAAVMEWLPAFRAVVAYVATPDPFSVPSPSVVVPS